MLPLIVEGLELAAPYVVSNLPTIANAGAAAWTKAKAGGNRWMGQLNPEAKEAFLVLQELAGDEGVNIIMEEGYRSAARQAKLYAQGRTRPGLIVTNAKPGQSRHETGNAFDISIRTPGIAMYDEEAIAYVGSLGRSIGLVWGGTFKGFYDGPHFELAPGDIA